MRPYRTFPPQVIILKELEYRNIDLTSLSQLTQDYLAVTGGELTNDIVSELSDIIDGMSYEFFWNLHNNYHEWLLSERPPIN
jgi:hypothetical protein